MHNLNCTPGTTLIPSRCILQTGMRYGPRGVHAAQLPSCPASQLHAHTPAPNAHALPGSQTTYEETYFEASTKGSADCSSARLTSLYVTLSLRASAAANSSAAAPLTTGAAMDVPLGGRAGGAGQRGVGVGRGGACNVVPGAGGQAAVSPRAEPAV